MIASFQHNFIFIKTVKTGGTSVEIVLSSWCSGRDICTPITPEDEVARAAFGGKPMNFESPDGDLRFYNHMPAKAIREALPDFWREAFKFTVERHPFEKVVSRAFWNIGDRGGDPNSEIADEIDRVIKKPVSYLNHRLYCIRDQLAVDEVIPYHRVWDRLAELARDLGERLPDPLPRAKARFRIDRRPASEILTKAQREQILSDAAFELSLVS